MIEDLCASLILYKKQENASMQINSENDLKFKIWSETFEKSDLRSQMWKISKIWLEISDVKFLKNLTWDVKRLKCQQFCYHRHINGKSMQVKKYISSSPQITKFVALGANNKHLFVMNG
jgi:hypothetical protein